MAYLDHDSNYHFTDLLQDNRNLITEGAGFFPWEEEISMVSSSGRTVTYASRVRQGELDSRMEWEGLQNAHNWHQNKFWMDQMLHHFMFPENLAKSTWKEGAKLFLFSKTSFISLFSILPSGNKTTYLRK